MHNFRNLVGEEERGGGGGGGRSGGKITSN